MAAQSFDEVLARLQAENQRRNDLKLLRAADVPRRPVEWLWPSRIAIGKVTLLVGDPGLGKSLVALDIAARVSRGMPWPDEGPGATSKDQRATNSAPSVSGSPLSPASAVLLSAEDDLADTIRPRLEALGANCNRVFVLSSLADLRNDFGQLQAAISQTNDCRVIVIDPINAYVGPTDSHFHTIVRKILAPLARFAAQKRMAILAVTHLRKHEGAAIYRATGSMGFVAAARAVWTICRDRENPGRHLMIPVKNNLAPTACGLAYSIEPHPKLSAPVICWHPGSIEISADEALAIKPRGPEAEDRIAAGQWLKQVLTARGPQAASDLIEEGAQLGFHSRTLQRAFHTIGGHTEKRGLLEGWWWSLSPNATTGT